MIIPDSHLFSSNGGFRCAFNLLTVSFRTDLLPQAEIIRFETKNQNQISLGPTITLIDDDFYVENAPASSLQVSFLSLYMFRSRD